MQDRHRLPIIFSRFYPSSDFFFPANARFDLPFILCFPMIKEYQERYRVHSLYN